MATHTNRARVYYADGRFKASVPVSEAERLIDFGYADRLGRPGCKPLRVRLRRKRRPSPEPRPNVPTSGCTRPALSTAGEIQIGLDDLIQADSVIRLPDWAANLDKRTSEHVRRCLENSKTTEAQEQKVAEFIDSVRRMKVYSRSK